jgi:hypothetical protein
MYRIITSKEQKEANAGKLQPLNNYLLNFNKWEMNPDNDILQEEKWQVACPATLNQISGYNLSNSLTVL